MESSFSDESHKESGATPDVGFDRPQSLPTLIAPYARDHVRVAQSALPRCGLESSDKSDLRSGESPADEP